MQRGMVWFLLIVAVFLKPDWIETCLEIINWNSQKIRLPFGIQFQMKTSPNSEQTIEIAFRDNILDLSKSNNEWSKRTIWKIWKNQIKNQFYINCKFFVLMRQRTKNRTFQRTGWICRHSILFYEFSRTNQTKHSKESSHFFQFFKNQGFPFLFIGIPKS